MPLVVACLISRFSKGTSRSLADDLVTGQGDVFSRAASTLRSVESQPLVGRLVFLLLRVLNADQVLGPFDFEYFLCFSRSFHPSNAPPIIADPPLTWSTPTLSGTEFGFLSTGQLRLVQQEWSSSQSGLRLVTAVGFIC